MKNSNPGPPNFNVSLPHSGIRKEYTDRWTAPLVNPPVRFSAVLEQETAAPVPSVGSLKNASGDLDAAAHSARTHPREIDWLS